MWVWLDAMRTQVAGANRQDQTVCSNADLVSAKTIADELSLSPGTVETFLSRFASQPENLDCRVPLQDPGRGTKYMYRRAVIEPLLRKKYKDNV